MILVLRNKFSFNLTKVRATIVFIFFNFFISFNSPN